MVLALFPFGVGMGGLVGLALWNGAMVGCGCEWNVVDGIAVRTWVVDDGDPNLSV